MLLFRSVGRSLYLLVGLLEALNLNQAWSGASFSGNSRRIAVTSMGMGLKGRSVSRISGDSMRGEDIYSFAFAPSIDERTHHTLRVRERYSLG